MPKPRSGEKRSDYISRFMGNARMRKKYPQQDQRAAVANSEWRSHRGGTSKKKGGKKK